MHWYRSIALATVLAAFPASSLYAADVWQRNAAELMEQGTTRGLRLTEDRKSLELARGRLYQDDGPAAGYSYLPNDEKISGDIAIRKQLLVDDPRAFETYLLVGAGKSGSGLTFRINGKSHTLVPGDRIGNHWDQFLLPPEALRKGLNEIVIGGTGTIWIARDDERPPEDSPPPNRSAKSTDGGKTWNDARLGTKDDFDGEYCVRLFLEQHVAAGVLTLPVVDQANLGERALSQALSGPAPVRVRVDAETPDDAQLTVFVRHGTTAAIDRRTWTSFSPLEGLDAVMPCGQFVQFEIRLTTKDARRTPQLHGVTIESTPPSRAAWTETVRVVEAPTTKIVRSSIPFEFESPSHPQLQELRKRYKLDDVVAGAETEWEQIKKLAAWSGVQWEKRTGHLKDTYPNWNALDILALHADGTPVGGFCQHYNLVFLQACASLGIRGRPVSLGPGIHQSKINGGHEVVEIWSNDLRKWVHVDGDAARYYVDVKTQTPLSLRELHDRQIAAFNDRPYDAVEAVVLADTRPAWTGFHDNPPFVELRLIPRSNFLAQPTPVPLNQGMRGWFWPGHEVWTDPEAPPARLYDRRVVDPGNWDWTLNTTEVRLLATDEPGQVRVELDTETPGFAGYEATVDDGGPQPVKNGFIWKLNDGTNRLTVRSRNETAALIPTTVVVERRP